jgi:hypothetical protein
MLEAGEGGRDGRWTESLAVGFQEFVETFAASLGDRVRGRGTAQVAQDSHVLRESRAAYDTGEGAAHMLVGDNTVEWDEGVETPLLAGLPPGPVS